MEALVFMLWLRRQRLPEQVDHAESIARVQKSQKLEERRVLHINTVTRFDRRLLDTPIVTGGVEIRRMACSLSSRSNGGARKGAVSATSLDLNQPVAPGNDFMLRSERRTR